MPGYLSSMSFYNHDWASTLQPDSPMPPDVTFVVREGDTVERFPGHRFLLATISSVFKVRCKREYERGELGAQSDDFVHLGSVLWSCEGWRGRD